MEARRDRLLDKIRVHLREVESLYRDIAETPLADLGRVAREVDSFLGPREAGRG
jgi:hypothetical protein